MLFPLFLLRQSESLLIAADHVYIQQLGTLQTRESIDESRLCVSLKYGLIPLVAPLFWLLRSFFDDTRRKQLWCDDHRTSSF
jgi:hypothetical protein